MDRINFLFSYIKHLFSAGTPHSVHSPFLFELYNSLLAKKHYYAFDKIESYRQKLLESDEKIEVTDFGAGSIIGTKTRKIKDIVRLSEKPSVQANILFELISILKPQILVELGTSFGLTTSYLASNNNKSIVHSFEGCPNTVIQAEKTIEHLKISNIQLYQGNFDDILPIFLKEIKTIDFGFFDGNHRLEPTLRYFEWFLPKINNDTVFVFDDIHWSKEMELAWKYIQKNNQVTLSVDFFHFGVVFFKKELSKQHFKLRI